MNPLLLAAAHQHLASSPKTASNSAATRVASEWLRKQANAGYDQLVRALILEGAAKVRPLTWANNAAARNLGKAKAMLLAENPNMDPQWFVREDTGAWKVLENRVNQIFRSNRLSQDQSMDILHSALYGLTKEGEQGAIPLWRAGQNLSDRILAGEETPKKVTAGLAGKWFVQKALAEIRTIHRRNQDHGKVLDIGENADQISEPYSDDFASVFMDIVTDPSNKVGREFRDYVMSVFEGTAQEAVGQMYYGTLFDHGEAAKKRDIATATGKSEQLVNNHIRLISQMVVQALSRNVHLLKKVETEVRTRGSDFPDTETFLDLLQAREASTHNLSRPSKSKVALFLAEINSILDV